MNSYLTYADCQLVQMLREGDRGAFETIYLRYLSKLYSITFKRLRHKEQTEDILQEVFTRLWVRRETHNINDLKAYLYTAVRNETINYITRSREIFCFYEPMEAILLETDSPDGQLVAKELLMLVHAYAATLPEKRKQVFLLHVQKKFSTREIAAELGISQKTVQNQLGTALKDFKASLAPVLIAVLTHHF